MCEVEAREVLQKIIGSLDPEVTIVQLRAVHQRNGCLVLMNCLHTLGNGKVEPQKLQALYKFLRQNKEDGMNILSVDWDYFFPDTAPYDWGHREAPLFYETLWVTRDASIRI